MIKKESILLKLYQYDLSEFDAQQIIGLSNAIKDNNPALLTAMRAKKNTAIDANITPRTINYWSEIGLFDKNNQIADNKWHKFSFVDIVFILIVAKLRDFGMNLEKIKTTKRDLYKLVALTDDNDQTIFESRLSVIETAILLAFSLQNHGNVYLLIENSGQATYFMDESFCLNRDRETLPDTYIYLNLNDLLHKNQIVGTLMAKMQKMPQKHTLTSNEKQVLDVLRQNNTEQIDITKDSKNGKLLYMKTLKNITNAQIDENTGFGEIREIKQNGKVLRRTVKDTIKFK